MSYLLILGKISTIIHIVFSSVIADEFLVVGNSMPPYILSHCKLSISQHCNAVKEGIPGDYHPELQAWEFNVLVLVQQWGGHLGHMRQWMGYHAVLKLRLRELYMQGICSNPLCYVAGSQMLNILNIASISSLDYWLEERKLDLYVIFTHFKDSVFSRWNTAKL